LVKGYYHDKFIVFGKEGKAYAFFLSNIPDPHPGVILLADNFEGYTPNIVFLENSENVKESIEKLRINPKIDGLLNYYFLGVLLEQLPSHRRDIFIDIWSGLDSVPKINNILKKFI